jgi:hypothetical protein
LEGSLCWPAYGLAFVMKQPGAAFALFGGHYLVMTGGRSQEQLRRSIRELAWYGVGLMLPFTITGNAGQRRRNSGLKI